MADEKGGVLGSGLDGGQTLLGIVASKFPGIGQMMALQQRQQELQFEHASKTLVDAANAGDLEALAPKSAFRGFLKKAGIPDEEVNPYYVTAIQKNHERFLERQITDPQGANLESLLASQSPGSTSAVFDPQSKQQFNTTGLKGPTGVQQLFDVGAFPRQSASPEEINQNVAKYSAPALAMIGQDNAGQLMGQQKGQEVQVRGQDISQDIANQRDATTIRGQNIQVRGQDLTARLQGEKIQADRELARLKDDLKGDAKRQAPIGTIIKVKKGDTEDTLMITGVDKEGIPNEWTTLGSGNNYSPQQQTFAGLPQAERESLIRSSFMDGTVISSNPDGTFTMAQGADPMKQVLVARTKRLMEDADSSKSLIALVDETLPLVDQSTVGVKGKVGSIRQSILQNINPILEADRKKILEELPKVARDSKEEKALLEMFNPKLPLLRLNLNTLYYRKAKADDTSGRLGVDDVQRAEVAIGGKGLFDDAASLKTVLEQLKAQAEEKIKLSDSAVQQLKGLGLSSQSSPKKGDKIELPGLGMVEVVE